MKQEEYYSKIINDLVGVPLYYIMSYDNKPYLSDSSEAVVNDGVGDLFYIEKVTENDWVVISWLETNGKKENTQYTLTEFINLFFNKKNFVIKNEINVDTSKFFD